MMQKYVSVTAGLGVTLIALTGCGGSHEATAPGATPSSAATSSAATSSAASPTVGSEGSGPPVSGAPVTSSAIPLTVSGTVEAGVEAGCIIVKASEPNSTVYTLVGNVGSVRAGQKVTLEGHITHGMSTCQQGSLFEVTKVLKAS